MENSKKTKQDVDFFYIKEKNKEFYIAGKESYFLKRYKPEHHLCRVCAMDTFMKCEKVLDGVASSSGKCFDYDYDFINSMSHHIELIEKKHIRKSDVGRIVEDLDSRMSDQEKKLGIYNLLAVQDYIADNLSSEHVVLVKASKLFDLIVSDYQTDEFYPYIPKTSFLSTFKDYNESYSFDSKKLVVLGCDNFVSETRVDGKDLVKRNIKL